MKLSVIVNYILDKLMKFTFDYVITQSKINLGNLNIIMDNLKTVMATQGIKLNDMWRYELLYVDENSIKVSNIIIAILFLVIGIKLSNKVSKWLENVLHRITKDKDATNALHKIAFYTLFITYAITVLEIANIPLKIFAFIGGALAISAGLGTQQLFNNLMSGILMVIEKPLRIGDIIQINDIVGKVISVGGRSTTIRQPNGSQTVVPNSLLMQNKLINWSRDGKNLFLDVVVTYNMQADNPLEYKKIQDKINKAASSVSYLKQASRLEVSLITINKSESQFLLFIEIQEKNLDKILLIKNELNFALVKHLGTNFTTIYPSYLKQ